MFSGIIEDLGEVVEVRPQGKGRALVIRTAIPVARAGEAGVGTSKRGQVGLGDSIAVMGACLTVDAVQPPDRFSVVAGAETLKLTVLGQVAKGDRVHLERSLRVGDPIDGHLVSGHVDGLGLLEEIRREQESWVLWVAVPPELSRYVAVKGSIAIDGVSLTVNELRPARGEPGAVALRVNVIPYTAEFTALGSYRAGRKVDLEVDQIARYLERLMGGGGPDPAPSSLSAERLTALGFGPTGRHGGS